jgi:tetratricopeptide (TPR) repeat protein
MLSSKSASKRAIAIALATMTLGVSLGAMAIGAPAAFAQGKASSEEFLNAYRSAKTLIDAGKYAEAAPKIESAAPLAKTNPEKTAIELMRIQAYGRLKKWRELIKAIEARTALGNVSAAEKKEYLQMRAGAYAALGETDKAAQLTKEYIDQYSGDSTQFAYVGSHALRKHQYDEAISYAQKAIDKARQEGKKPNPNHYNIVLTAYRNSGKLDQYYATLERVAPILNSETYWRPLVERAKKEPRFKSSEALLDVYRAMEGSGVKLTTQEQKEMGEFALNSSLPIESERVLAPLVKSGAYGGAKDDKDKAGRNLKFFERAQTDAKAAKAGGLQKLEAEAGSKPTGADYVLLGQSYQAMGEHAKAIEMYQKGLTLGNLEPGIAELTKLRLGVAQYKTGKKDEARKIWSETKADNGAGWLARVWTAISKT